MVPSLLNFIPETLPAVSVALRVRITVVEVVVEAPELMTTLPVGAVVSTSVMVSVTADDQFPELSLNLA